MRKTALGTAFGAALAAAAGLAGSATAQTYPAKPIKLVVPFAPGGPADVIGRIIGQQLNIILGQSFVIENGRGAGGSIGARFAAGRPLQKPLAGRTAFQMDPAAFADQTAPVDGTADPTQSAKHAPSGSGIRSFEPFVARCGDRTRTLNDGPGGGGGIGFQLVAVQAPGRMIPANLLDEIDDASPELFVLDLHERLDERQSVRGREELVEVGGRPR